MPEYQAPRSYDRWIEHSAKGLLLTNGAHIRNRSPQMMQHFVEGTVANTGFTATDTGGGTAFALSTSVVGGAAVGVSAGTTNNAEELGGNAISWQPSTMALSPNNYLFFECRAKFVGTTTATDGDFYLGLADNKTYTNSLPYVLSAASAFTTSVPSDFVGFGYTSIATSGTAFQSGGNPIVAITTKANVDTVTDLNNGTLNPSFTSGRLIKDSNFHIYRIEVDSSGNANFFIDDYFVGYVGSATTAATSFTPYVNAVAKNSHVHTATVDYVFIGGAAV